MAARMRAACLQAIRTLDKSQRPLSQGLATSSNFLFGQSADIFQLRKDKSIEKKTYASTSASWASLGFSPRWTRKEEFLPTRLPRLYESSSPDLQWKRGIRTEATKEVTIDHLEGDLEGAVTVSLVRPHAKNALGRTLLEQLRDSIERIHRDDGIRALIVQSTVPKVFCAGADLKERKEMTQEEVQDFVQQLGAAFKSLEDLRIPTIAAIEGAALGGGLELALACDLRVGGQNARLGLPETGLAIIPGAGGTQRLPRLVGVSRAKELIFTGKILDAQEAFRIGLINHLVGPGEALDKALEIAAEILKKGPVAIQAAKAAIDRGFEARLVEGLGIEQECYAVTLSTKDRLEGLAAFAEKRAPIYTGT